MIEWKLENNEKDYLEIKDQDCNHEIWIKLVDKSNCGYDSLKKIAWQCSSCKKVKETW